MSAPAPVEPAPNESNPPKAALAPCVKAAPPDAWAALHRRMRVAAYLVGSGLAVQAATLAWTAPPTFLVFLNVGAVLVGLGAVMYLYAIARHPGHDVVEALPPALAKEPPAAA